MSETITVHCPKCGSEDIREKNVAYAELPVWEWDEDETGQLHPADYDTDVSADWEVEDVAHQYICRGCDKWEGSVDELVVRRAPSGTTTEDDSND